MKLILKPTLVAVAVLAVMGCQQKEEEKAVVLETDIQKQAYGLGSSIGSYMNNNLEQQEKMGVTLDKELLIAGFKESINGKSQLEKTEIEELLKSLDQQIQQKRVETEKLASEKNLTEGQAFLDENAKAEGVVTTDSGLQYQVIKDAEGAKPKATDTVKVHYKGTLVDGTTFDSSYDHGQPIEFPLNRVIPGWTEGVQLMSVGSSYKFVIPSDLAYGPAGSGPIPGNSTLIFDVELIDIVTSASAEAANDK